MTAGDTRTRLLDAAEQLFAEHGFHGSSVRAITDLAGANLAAVGYHFGSKAELLTAVVRRVVEPMLAAQSAGLDRLLARTPDPPVADLVAAFAGPLFDELRVDEVRSGNEAGARRSRLMVTIVVDPAEEMRSWTGAAEDTVRDRYFEAFTRARPGVPAEELWFRMRAILAVVAMDRVDAYNRPPPVTHSPATTAAARARAIALLTAGMNAPPTAP